VNKKVQNKGTLQGRHGMASVSEMKFPRGHNETARRGQNHYALAARLAFCQTSPSFCPCAQPLSCMLLTYEGKNHPCALLFYDAMNKLHGGREMGRRQDFTSSKSNMWA